MEGKTQQAAAAVSATSERSVRRWQRGSLPSERRRNRRGWRTRPEMNGESYRLKQSRQAEAVRAACDPADA